MLLLRVVRLLWQRASRHTAEGAEVHSLKVHCCCVTCGVIATPAAVATASGIRPSDAVIVAAVII